MSVDPAALEQCFAELACAGAELRTDALHFLCDESPELADQLVRLLHAHDSADDSPLALDGEHLLEKGGFDPERMLGRQLGAWTLIRVAGYGGMAVVYEAEQERDGIIRQAAVKLLDTGPFTPEASKRLVREALTLARLDHPGVCRLLDWGHSPEGSPYLVLELVRGTPLSTDATTPIGERLDNIARIADAVEAAHRQGIVHLDIKPANVLMTPDRGPILVDFGGARLLNEVYTADDTAVRWLTPAYASPEQLRGEAASTASDIYALGILLYEVSTGKHLFDLGPVPRPGAPRRINGPSMPPSKVLRGLPRDLDVICSRAMHTDPTRRYTSAAAFANDVRALMEKRPISVRPSTFGYRFLRSVARHPAVTGFAVMASISLLALGLATFWLVDKQREDKVRTTTAIKRTRASANILLDSLKGAGSHSSGGMNATVGDVLTTVEKRIEEDFASYPMARARSLLQMANVRLGLADHIHALRLFRGSLAAMQQAQSNDRDLRSEVVAGMAAAQRGLGRFREADQLLESEIARDRPVAHWRLLHARATLRLAQGRHEQALPDLQQALLRLPTGDANRPTVLSSLGVAYFKAGRYAVARHWHERAVMEADALRPKDRRQLAFALSNLAETLVAQGEIRESQRLLSRAAQLNHE